MPFLLQSALYFSTQIVADHCYFALSKKSDSGKNRGGIELLTGNGNAMEIPDGTSTAIVDAWVSPAGGGAGAGSSSWFIWFLDMLTDWTNNMGNASQVSPIIPQNRDQTKAVVDPIQKYTYKFITTQGVDPNFSSFPSNGYIDTVTNGIQIWNNGTRDSIVFRRYVRKITGTSPFGGQLGSSRPLNFNTNVEK